MNKNKNTPNNKPIKKTYHTPKSPSKSINRSLKVENCFSIIDSFYFVMPSPPTFHDLWLYYFVTANKGGPSLPTPRSIIALLPAPLLPARPLEYSSVPLKFRKEALSPGCRELTCLEKTKTASVIPTFLTHAISCF